MDQIQTLLHDHSIVAIIGAQWGDEGKGKLVDYVAEGWADIVARGTGGANAGHTIRNGNLEFAFHLIPSGILHDAKLTTICGNGMAICPRSLLEEMRQLTTLGLTHNNLKIAYNANLTLPHHILMDWAMEEQACAKKIGTTGRGIGPTYADRTARCGLVIHDLLHADRLCDKLRRNLQPKLPYLQSLDDERLREMVEKLGALPGYEFISFDSGTAINLPMLVDGLLAFGEKLTPWMSDTDAIMREAKNRGKKVLLEGAQGFLLSLDYGTMPFVTSSDCSTAGLAKGVGLRESDIGATILVAKAPYMTRVGEGPFPTEFGGKSSTEWCSSIKRDKEEIEYPAPCINSENEFEQGMAVRRLGNEYGSTTGRPRRTGWLDLFLLKHALSHTAGDPILALTKLDVMDTCQTLKLGVGYIFRGECAIQLGDRIIQPGERLPEVIMDLEILNYCEPVYKTCCGWMVPITGMKDEKDIPKDLLELLWLIHQETDIPVEILSFGPDREQTLVLRI